MSTRESVEVNDFRWRERYSIVSLTAAPAGWTAVIPKSKTEEDYDLQALTPHGFAWFEPIACFALVEVEEYQQMRGVGDERWQDTGKTDPAQDDPSPRHRMILPVIRQESMRFPGADEIWDAAQEAVLILGPNEEWTTPWIRERVTGGGSL